MYKRHKKAFTLIELLTVIAIIGILASILIPVVATVRESGRRSLCLSNLRQVSHSAVIYATDNNGHLPFPNWGMESGKEGWLYTAPIQRGGRVRVNPVTLGSLWDYLQDETVYQCPTDWMEKDSALFRARTQGLSSYVMNGSASGFSQDKALLIEQFRSDAIMFWEADERLPFYYNDGANYPSEGISTRHGKGAHIAGIDGHVEILSEQQYEIEVGQRPSRFWNNPRSATGD